MQDFDDLDDIITDISRPMEIFLGGCLLPWVIVMVMVSQGFISKTQEGFRVRSIRSSPAAKLRSQETMASEQERLHTCASLISFNGL